MCKYCEKSCEHTNVPKEKNTECPFVVRHNIIQAHIVKQHVEKHFWYHPELLTIQNAELDLLKMIAPICRQYECESCIHNNNCEVQEEANK